MKHFDNRKALHKRDFRSYFSIQTLCSRNIWQSLFGNEREYGIEYSLSGKAACGGGLDGGREIGDGFLDRGGCEGGQGWDGLVECLGGEVEVGEIEDVRPSGFGGDIVSDKIGCRKCTGAALVGCSRR